MSHSAPTFVSSVQPEHRPGLVAVARSEWTKIRSLRSTFWALVVTAGLTIGLGMLFALGRTSGREPIGPDFNAGVPAQRDVPEPARDRGARRPDHHRRVLLGIDPHDLHGRSRSAARSLRSRPQSSAW